MHIRIANTNLSNSSTRGRHTKGYLYDIYELAFLKVFTSWEEFLESTFVAYMAGGKTKKFKPKLYLRKIDQKRARDILCGTRNYPDWTNIADVHVLAELYFVDGRPFLPPLKEIEIDFNQMKKVRNAIAHISIQSKENFLGLVKAKLSTYDADITPGEFLASSIKRNSNETFFTYYIQFLQIAASKIIRI